MGFSAVSLIVSTLRMSIPLLIALLFRTAWARY